ncbi:hypothetical protein LINPERPRIM_LOCUS30010 [Linum perenne]
MTPYLRSNPCHRRLLTSAPIPAKIHSSPAISLSFPASRPNSILPRLSHTSGAIGSLLSTTILYPLDT